jgi:hypothetical protein
VMPHGAQPKGYATQLATVADAREMLYN